MDDANKLVIPDTSLQAPPAYSVPEKPDFTPPQEAPLSAPAVTNWHTQAAPALIFGAPDGWSDAPPERVTWLPIEQAHMDPDAPLLKETRIVAALEHAGSGNHTWTVQLRRFANPLAEVVMQNPTNWARAKSSWCEPLGAPLSRSVAGRPAVILRYAYILDGTLYTLYETWLLHGGGGYHFMLTAPAADEAQVWPQWEAMLASARAQADNAAQTTGAPTAPQTVAPPPPRPGPPVVHYRCPVATQVPVTLSNVTSQNPSAVVIAGSPSLAAWSLFGVAAARLFGSVRARQMEGQTVAVPATGEALLMDDRVLLRLIVAPQAGGLTLRGGSGDRSVDLEIPYRLLRGVGSDARGVWLDVVGRGALWLQPQDRGELAPWLARLSAGKTWQPPARIALQVTVPVVGWLQQDPRFTLGLPAGWAPVASQALADYGRLFYPSALRAGAALASGDLEAQVLVIDNGPANAGTQRNDEESLAASLMSASNITPNGPVAVTTMGGEPLALLRGYAWDSEGKLNDRCYGALTHGGVSYALWYVVEGARPGDGAYETWLPHFHTMLATWRWYV